MRRVEGSAAILASQVATAVFCVLQCGLASSDIPAPVIAHASEPAFLEEIVVTATRRPTLLSDTALSVSAISGERLRASGARDIVDWFTRVPGLEFSDSGFGHSITIRGVTPGLRPATAVYLDDTPFALFAGSAALLQYGGSKPASVDLDRVEVLRGPQGTLFGSGALGGAVRTFTRVPDLERLDWSGTAGFSSTEHGGWNYELDGMLNLPFADDKAAVRIVGYYRDESGYIDNPTLSTDDINDVETTGGRIGLRWRPTDNLDVVFRAHRQQRATGGLSLSDIDAGSYEQTRYITERDDETWEIYNLAIGFDMKSLRLESSTSYVDREPNWDWDVTAFASDFYQYFLHLDLFHPVANDFNVSIRHFVQELRLVSKPAGRLEWLLGAYYERQRDVVTQYWNSPGFDERTGGLAAAWGYPDKISLDGTDSTLYQRAVFGEATWHFSAAWALTLGDRWSEFTLDHLQVADGLGYGMRSEWGASYDETGHSPKVGVAYRPRKDRLYFVNVAAGLRPGGPNQFDELLIEACRNDLAAAGFDGAPPPFESDSIWSYELGTRLQFPSRRLAVDASAYHIDWEDMQTFTLLNCGAGYGANAGAASSDGFELELQWQPRDDTNLSVTAAYVDSKLEEDAPSVGGERDDTIPGIPPWTLGLQGTQRYVLTPSVEAFATADYRYRSAYWTDYNEELRDRIEPLHLLDLRTGLVFHSMTLELFVENLLDERVVLAASNNIVGHWESVGRPRTIGVRLLSSH